MEARYAYQVWELNVPLDSNVIKDAKDLEKLIESFHEMHERVFGIKEPGQIIEFVNWGSQAIAKVPNMVVKEHSSFKDDPDIALVAKRNAYFRELGGMIETSVYRGDKLMSGTGIEGPAIIQEPTSTLVVFPNCSASVSRFGNYLIELNGN